MTEQERNDILQKIKQFLKDNVIEHHIENTRNLKLKDFKRNPLMESYLAKYAFGNDSPEAVAKILVYPRLLGTSITTTFGTGVQKMCSSVLSAYGSTTQGIDIEYISSDDGRRKYCQLKAGPQTINKDDVKTICDHFQSVKNLGRTNSVKINDDDCIVGIIYGTHTEISDNYKRIEKNGYTILAGSEFWKDLTGDSDFYSELIKVMGDIVSEMDASLLLQDAVSRIEKELS